MNAATPRALVSGVHTVVLTLAMALGPSAFARAGITFGEPEILAPFGSSFAIGQLNGDTFPDLVIARDIDNSIQVALGVPPEVPGHFAPNGPTFAVGSSPVFVTLADLNQDGHTDVIVVNRDSNDVSVLIGNGAGGLGPQIRFAVGSQPSSAAIGDLDGDAVPDLVSGNVGSNDVTVRLGTGTGGFGPQSRFATGALPRAVTLADVNEDGRLDVLAANTGAHSISVLLGVTAGAGPYSSAWSLGSKTDFAVTGSPHRLIPADLNGDGHLDVVTAGDDAGAASILFGSGRGTFGNGRDLPIAGAISVAAGDISFDGKTDLIVSGGDSLTLFLGTGIGEFASPIAVPYVTGEKIIALRDVNGDALDDIIAMDRVGSSSPVLLLRHITAEEVKALQNESAQMAVDLAALNPGLGTCSATLSSCQARLGPAPAGLQRLSVIKAVGGTIVGPGIRCGTGGSACTIDYPAGVRLALDQVSDVGFTFAGWSADCANGSVVMTATRSCAPAFAFASPGPPSPGPPPDAFSPLTIIRPTGGMVFGAGIRCGDSGAACAISFPAGIRIGLEAVPSAGFEFSGWTGAGCSSLVTLTRPLTCGATFLPAR